jgi:SSS family solute:Na+ symporter
MVSYVLPGCRECLSGGLVFQQVFGIEELWGIGLLLDICNRIVLFQLYNGLGGMKSVVYTSVLQTDLDYRVMVIVVLGLRAVVVVGRSVSRLRATRY